MNRLVFLIKILFIESEMMQILYKTFYFIFLCATGLSCTLELPLQFSPNSDKQDQVFSIEDIHQLECGIRTLSAFEENSLEISAQHLVIEANQPPSVVFPSESSLAPPIINNLPFVQYQVEGSSVCELLLAQKTIRLIAQPNEYYKVHFQIVGSYLRVFISGDLHRLPYQWLSQRVVMKNGQYALPIGVYSILQGRVQPMKNVENEEIHILDFFPNEEPLVRFEDSKGLVHWVRSESQDIFIVDLNKGLTSYQYQEKKNILPKNYFDGEWYSQVSLHLTEPLKSQGGWGSGVSVSGNNYSGKMLGQKIYFKFEFQNLKALNYNYAHQTQSLNLGAEAEALSIPIEHLDYRNVINKNEDVSQEKLDKYTSWQDKKYISAHFDKVSDFFRDWVKRVGVRYGYDLSDTTTLKEIRFASNYFDFVVYDGTFEYRFSFFKKEKDSHYKPKTIAATDLRFEFFNVPYNQVFSSPLDSFNREYEEKINLLRPQPDKDGNIHIHFSRLTPKNDKTRSIGREAVFVWNQALEKASLPLKLVLHEDKDVNLGDSRYHVLHIPEELKKAYGGIAQTLVDDETGEVISSTSTVLLDDYKFFLEKKIIDYVYTKYSLINSITSPFVDYPKIKNNRFAHSFSQEKLPFSVDTLEYVWVQHTMNQHQSVIFPRSVKNSWYDSILQYFEFKKDVRKNWLQTLSNPTISDISHLPPELKAWWNDFKLQYALIHQKFVEEENWNTILENVRQWGATSEYRSIASSNLHQTLSKVCHFLPHPLQQEKDVFKTAVRQCVEAILPIYGLGIAVHEIGHSIFSLRHNFAGSTDAHNIKNSPSYQLKHLKSYLSYTDSKGQKTSLEDQFNPVSSSVMEYIAVADGDQWGPGSYDIAAIEYLFADFGVSSKESVEKDSVEKFSNHFERCSDYEVNTSAYCLTHDKGVTPLEITRNEVRNLLEYLNQNFYDLEYSVSPLKYHFTLFRQIKKLVVIYSDWRAKLRNLSVQFLNESPEKLDQQEWKKLINEVILRGKSDIGTPQEKELYSFYQARNLIYHTLTYLSFLPNRYCVLEKRWSRFKNLEDKKWKPSVKVLLELSKVIAHQRVDDSQPQLKPLLSCWASEKKAQPHPVVERYMKTYYPHYKLQEEVGHFLYPDSFPKNAPYRHLFRPSSYKGSVLLRLFAFAALSMTQPIYQASSHRPAYFSMMSEHDISEGVERLLITRLTRGVFLYQTDFFKSLQNISFEDLTPEKSAQALFKFPSIRKGQDLVLRDEFIQPSKLIDKASRPYMRDDQNRLKFYQNFSEESSLLNIFNMFFHISYSLSSGFTHEMVSNKSVEWTKDLDLFPALTSFVLASKARNHIPYNIYPQLSSLYYFELDDILVLPSFSISSDNFGNHLLSELSKNSVRQLWTPLHNKMLQGSSHPVFQNSGLVEGLFSYLQKLIQQYQGTRLGRFYFMYAYLSILGQLEAYEYILKMESPIDLHKQTNKWTSHFENTINELFYFRRCQIEDINSYLNKLSQIAPSFRQVDAEDKSAARSVWGGFKNFLQQKIQISYSKYCPSPLKDRGKMVDMFYKQGLIFNTQRSQEWNSTLRGNQKGLNYPYQKITTDFFFQETLNSLESHLSSQGGVPGIHLSVQMLFHELFSTSDDVPLMQSRVSMLRQLMIDVVPKMMLMYSEDRIFIGEMMILMSVMHQFCFYGDPTGNYCRLATEKIVGNYFKGSNYGEDEKINNIFGRMFDGYLNDSNKIPVQLFLSKNAKNYFDRSINTLPFDLEVITDYLFYERGWDASDVNNLELNAQRQLLFSLLPLTSLRMLNSSLVFKLANWNPILNF